MSDAMTDIRNNKKLRDEIESLRQQLADSQKQVTLLRDALRALTQCAPTEVECNNMHHKKQDQHDYDETCPVVVRYATALYDGQEALAATEPK